MSFDVKIANQSEEIVKKLHAAFYQKLHMASSKTKWIRLTGLGVGIISGCLTIAMRIVAIAENSFKGILNIFSCHICTGLNQLLCQNLIQIIRLPFTSLSAALNIFKTTVSMALDPQKHTMDRWFELDPQAKQRQENIERKRIFDNAESLLQNNPNDIVALRIVANAYFDGIIVRQDRVKSLELYERAAANGDIDLMYQVGCQYWVGEIVPKNEQIALKWFLKAAQVGNVDAMASMGVFYDGKIDLINERDALSWLFAATKHGHVGAMQFYAVKLLYGRGIQRSLAEAVKWFRTAATRGNAISICYLASILRQHPNLGEKDEWFAWFKKASQLKDRQLASSIQMQTFCS